MHADRLGLARLVEQAQALEEFEEALAAAARALPADPAAILEFFEIPTGDAFDVKPSQAIEFFKAKGLKPTFSYADMMDQAHDHAFTVAKMMDVDMLGQIRASLDSALANGQPFREWADSITPILQSGGWWGRQAVIDPLTGQQIIAQLGSPWRLETIFRTNLMSAYAAGAWQEIDAQKDIAPFLMYDAIDDFRTRPLHASWDRTVLPTGHPWWEMHYPPNGYNCRCGVIQLSAEELEGLGLKPNIDPPKTGTYDWTNPRTGEEFVIPKGIDPGFTHNSGKSWQWKLKQLLKEKVDALAADMAAAARKSTADAQKISSDAIAAAQAAQLEAASATAKAALARAQALAKEKAAQWAAAQQVDAIAKGKADAIGKGAAYKVKALQALKKEADWPDLKPTDQLAKIDELAAGYKLKTETASKLSTYKKAVLDGKTPPPATVKAFQALSPEDQAALLAKIDAEKAAIEAKKAAEAAEAAKKAAAAAAVGTPPNTAKLTQIGGQGGSNPGGLFQDTETGIKWYVKWPPDAEMIRNEVLAAKLYELGGVDVPEVHIVQYNGRTAIASRYLDGLAKGSPDDIAAAAGTADGFAFDAWLANWDAVGLTFDNLLLKGGKGYRIDVGGSLRYKATGTLKPGVSFGDTVGELDSMKNAGLNPQAAAVFGKIDQAQFEAGVKRLLALDEAKIRATVQAYGPGDAATRAKLADTLIARRADIAKRYPQLAPASAEAVQAAVAAEADKIQYVVQRLDGAILTAVKGIASRAAKGAALEAKDIERVAEADDVLKELRAAAASMKPQAADDLLNYYEPWVNDLKAAVAPGAGSPAQWQGTIFKTYAGAIDVDPSKVKVAPLQATPAVTPPGAANKIIMDAWGTGAARMKIPRLPGADRLTKNMHDEHARAITSYTGSYYRELNLNLRTGKASPEEKLLEKLLNEALDLAPVYKGTVYRGLDLDSAGKAAFVATHKAAQAAGKPISHNQFNSTSRSAGGSFDGNVRLVIESKRGVHVAPISLISSEDEVLFKSTAKYRVNAIDEGPKITTIYLDEI